MKHIVFFLLFFLISCQSAEIREVDMSLEVMDRLGLNTETNHLNFGGNMPGNTIKRSIDISYPTDCSVSVKVKGDLKEWIVISDPKFELAGGETKRVFFTAQIPLDALYGNYSSSAVFSFD